MRERLSKGSCETRNTSSRWAASSEVTMNFMCAKNSLLRTAYGGAGSGRRRNPGGGIMAAQPQGGAGHDQQSADDLHQRQSIVEQERAAWIAAEKLDCAALDSIEYEIGADDASGRTPLCAK